MPYELMPDDVSGAFLFQFDLSSYRPPVVAGRDYAHFLQASGSKR